MTNNASIENFLANEGISIMGTASASHTTRVSHQSSPQTLLANAESVICYGIPIPKGIVYATSYDVALYWRYCNMSYRFLDIVSDKLSVVLEEEGHLAVPVYGCYPWRVIDRKFWGLLPLVYWAELAGLGTVTRCGLLGTPEYGTRVLLGGVVTSAPLVYDRKLDKDICPSDCCECVNACPPGAIGETGEVDHNMCIRYANKNPMLHHLLKDGTGKYPFETLINTVGVDDHGTYVCFECVKTCPLNR